MTGWGSALKKGKTKIANAILSFQRPAFTPAVVDWKHLVVLDFETYFDQDYTLRKLSTSEYIRDERFHAHMVSVKIGDRPTEVIPHAKLKARLQKIDWSKHDLLCHHAQFDGFILSHHYGVIPRKYYCTLSMARGWLANDIGAGLDEVAQHLGIGHKIPDVLNMMRGIRDLPPELYQLASKYAAMDAELCLGIFKKLLEHFPQSEIDLIDLTCQMFCCPVLRLDEKRAHAEMVREIAAYEALLVSIADPDITFEKLPRPDQRELLQKVAVPTDRDVKIFNAKKQLGSGPKLAALLRAEGVEPPMKVSPTWIKMTEADKELNIDKKYTFAFAKDDIAFLALAEEGDERVAALVEARIAVKGGGNISRAARLLVSGKGGRAIPVYYKYAGAHTWRFSGGDNQNFQNFKRGGELRKSLLAPKGHVIVVADSSQIEARMNGWFWDQDDLTLAFRQRRDVYSEFAGDSIYGKVVTKADKLERHVGKTAILGLGYQMGPDKFRATLAKGTGGPKVFITLDEAKAIVNAYRRRNFKIVQGWAKCQRIIEDMAAGRTGSYKCISWEKETIWLPNGVRLKYPKLQKNDDDQWVYSRKGQWVKIYGGLLCENLVQALARIVVASFQMLKIAERYPVVMTTHDEVGVVVPRSPREPVSDVFEGKVAIKDYKPSGEAGKALKFMIETMMVAPDWCSDCPVSAEGVYNTFYDK